MKFRLVTVIWGADFVDIFLRICLRSLLAEGNLPDLAKNHEVIYTIYTTPEDVCIIEAHPSYAQLRAQVDVRFSLFSTHEIDSGDYGSHNILWKRGVELAHRNKQILFFIIPDLVYARGTLLHWAHKFEGGSRAIYTPGPQVVLETFITEIERRFPADEMPISIKPEEITPLMLQHLHPLRCGLLRDTPYRVSFPEYDVRAVEGRGIVFRELTAQPFCIDPTYFGSLINFSPTDELDAITVEPCMTLSVEPLCKRAEWSYRPWRLDNLRISQLGSFFDFFAPPGCLRDSETAHLQCLTNDETWRVKSARAIVGGRLFRASLVVTLKIYRLIMEFEKHNLRRAASVMAAALYATKLRRQIRLRGDATLLVPNDEAFAASSGVVITDLLAPGRENELIDLIYDHVLTDESLETTGSRCTARGLPFAQIADGANIVSGPHIFDNFKIYVIDTVLRRTIPAEAAPPLKPPGVLVAAAVDTSEYTSAAGAHLDYMDKMPVAVLATDVGGGTASSPPWLLGAWGYPAWASRSPIRRAYYLAMHLPVAEFILALLVPIYFRRNFGRFARAMLRTFGRLYVTFFRMTLGSERDFRHDVRAVLRRTKNLAIAAVRLSLRLVKRIPILRRGPALAWLMYRGLRYARTHGLTATMMRAGWSVRYRLTAALAELHARSLIVPKSAIAALQDVRLVRSLLAIENLLGYFSAAALPKNMPSAPLDLIRRVLLANGLGGELADLAVEQTLQSLVKEHPEYAEFWLELGYLRVDQNRVDEALHCYARAASGRAIIVAPQHGTAHPSIQARINAARILTERGDFAAARSEYDVALAIAHDQSMAHIEYGLLLRKDGETDKALAHFAAGTRYDWPSWPVPKAGRDVTKLSFPNLVRPSVQVATIATAAE